jgi:hypothetical protein
MHLVKSRYAATAELFHVGNTCHLLLEGKKTSGPDANRVILETAGPVKGDAKASSEQFNA